MNFSPTQPVDLAAAAVCGSHAMTAASTSIAPVVEDDIEDLEDLGGAETADGVRVTRDLPPVVTLRAKRSASRAAVGGGGANTDGVGHRSRANDSDGRGAQSDDDNDEEGDDVPEILGSSKPAGASAVPGVAKVHVKTFGCSHNHSDSEFMAGQLGAYGYDLVTDPGDADVWVVNTCTVKNPSQSAMNTVITKGKAQGKKLVIAGCVPQGDKKAKELEDLSLIGVTQIDRIVDVVERTLAGDAVRLLEKKPLPSLDLPKVRRNEHVEILPLSTGCLGQCTYCKTKHARGELGSYSPEALVQRVQTAIAEGVTEIWLSSEDTGAYGIDLGTDITRLLRDLTAVLPTDGSCMLRLGMTNPPYILAHLDAVADAMHHPSVYAFLHIPVQAGSDAVLDRMKREYVVAEFEKVADTLLAKVPGITIATDIICGFPGETSQDWEKTMALCRKYEFVELHLSQFYPRPGTPAARMKRVDTKEVKRRSRELTAYIESYRPHDKLVGTTQKVWVTDVAKDKVSLVGHTKSYVQVLLPGGEENKARLMGKSAEVRIIDAHRWHVTGELIEVHDRTAPRPEAPPAPKYSSPAAEAWDLKTRKRKEAAARADRVNEKGNNACSSCGAPEGETCGGDKEGTGSSDAETTTTRNDESLGTWMFRALTTAPENRLEWILTAGVFLGLLGIMLSWVASHLSKIASGVSAIASMTRTDR